ncbi:MAG: hypothetical protein U0840_21655 [Gemmataceae bacterium]
MPPPHRDRSPEPQRFVLWIRDTAPVGSEAPDAIIRLRQILKRLLRSFNFRCERVSELPLPSAEAAPSRGIDDHD